MNHPRPQSAYPGTGALIDRITTSLAKADEAEMARIPESLFVNMFLPFFSGQRVVEEDAMPAKWIGIAGNPFASVQVFSDSTREILYTVPPLFDIDAVGLSNRKRGGIHHMVRMVADLSLIHPSQGINYFNKYISELEILHDRKEEAVAQTRVWMEIFKRYNIVPKDFTLPDGTPPPAEVKKETSAQQVNFDDADLL